MVRYNDKHQRRAFLARPLDALVRFFSALVATKVYQNAKYVLYAANIAREMKIIPLMR